MEFLANSDYVSLYPSSMSSFPEDTDLEDNGTTTTYPPRNIGNDNDFVETDYWFGKMYFRCALAEMIFYRTTPRCHVLTVDSLLESQIEQFPYQRAMDSCYENNIAQANAEAFPGRKPRTQFLILVGSVVRKATPENKRRLLDLLQNRGPERLESTERSEAASTAQDSTVSAFPAPIMPLPVQEQDTDGPKFTAKLKEHGDVAGFTPQYRFREISKTPSWFEAVVTFKDYVFEGHGRNKQLAKHASSKQACVALGLDID